MGFSAHDVGAISLAIAEVARNIINHAGGGLLTISEIAREGRVGLVVVAQDDGPGIRDVGLALQDGYSTNGGMGMGLPLVAETMDEFDIRSERGEGTTVTFTKWLQEQGAGGSQA